MAERDTDFTPDTMPGDEDALSMDEAMARLEYAPVPDPARPRSKMTPGTRLGDLGRDPKGQFLPRQGLSQTPRAIRARKEREAARARAVKQTPPRPVIVQQPGVAQTPAILPRPAAPAPVPKEPPMAEKPRYWVRWVNPASGVFKYFGIDYDHGQLVPLRPGPTYEKLLNIMYVAEVDQPRLIARCGVCGADFLNERFLNAHGAKRHSDRFATADDLEVHAALQTEHGDAAAVDVTGDALERRLMTEFPLALENTTASREG